MCVENTFEKGVVGALHHHPHTQITYVGLRCLRVHGGRCDRTVHKGDTILKEDGVEHGSSAPKRASCGYLHPHAGGFCQVETLWDFCDRVIYVFAFCILLIILVGNAAVTAHVSYDEAEINCLPRCTAAENFTLQGKFFLNLGWSSAKLPQPPIYEQHPQGRPHPALRATFPLGGRL